jgi:hypothetical protein
VLLAGEPGIGKSRLARELAERARAAGCRVLAGRAYETEGAPPYLPFSEPHREHVRGRPPALVRAQLGDGAAATAALLPNPASRLLTLTGPDGGGKTRLGLQVAADAVDEFDHGVWFVSLAPVAHPDPGDALHDAVGGGRHDGLRAVD